MKPRWKIIVCNCLTGVLAAGLHGGCASAVKRTEVCPAGVRAAEAQASPLRLRAESVRRSLGEERCAFLRSRDPERVFAVFYFHVTGAILAMVDGRKLEHPNFWLDEMIAFHADYERSRQPLQREPHWFPYYDKAARLRGGQLCWWNVASPADLSGGSSLTGLGAKAHIGIDLPRSLAAVLHRYPSLAAGQGRALERDFFELTGVFQKAAGDGFSDLESAFPGLRLIPLRDTAAAWLVERMRRKAWRDFQQAAGWVSNFSIEP